MTAPYLTLECLTEFSVAWEITLHPQATKQKKIRSAGHVAHIITERCVKKFYERISSHRDRNGAMILKLITNMRSGRFIQLEKTGITNGVLLTWLPDFGLHKRWRIPWPASEYNFFSKESLSSSCRHGCCRWQWLWYRWLISSNIYCSYRNSARQWSYLVYK